jgi:hypothetical protein
MTSVMPKIESQMNLGLHPNSMTLAMPFLSDPVISLCTRRYKHAGIGLFFFFRKDRSPKFCFKEFYIQLYSSPLITSRYLSVYCNNTAS